MVTFEAGKRYIVIYKIPGIHRSPRKFCATYIGVNNVLDELVFSGRPQFGTSELRLSHVISAEVTTVDCFVPRPV